MLGFGAVIVGAVTPFTGVWIEMNPYTGEYEVAPVTPFTGVWIEISRTGIR